MSSSKTALEKFRIIRPFLEDGVSLASIASEQRISERTLRRWIDRYRETGLDGLERRGRADKGRRRKVTAEIEQLVQACALQKPLIPIKAIQRKIKSIAEQKHLSVPTYGVVYDIVHRMNPALMTLAHEGSKAYREQYDLIYRREATEPNEMWQTDHTLLDIFLLDNENERQRPWLTTIVDDYSRALAGYFLSFDSPCAVHTALALRQAIWRKDDPRWPVCGIPQALYTDNGSDFISQHIEQACLRLKIRLIHSVPGQPQGRGRIERLFSTINQTLLVDLPGYSHRGSAVTPPKLSFNEFAGLFERFIHDIYHCQIHSATGTPPLHRWQGKNFLPNLPESVEQLDGLLLRVGKSRKVQRDGIRFQGMRYIDPTLAAFVGEDVEILFDPRDLAEIQVHFQNAFLCRAVCQNIAGKVLALKDIKQARQNQKARLRKQIKAAQTALSAITEPTQTSTRAKPTIHKNRLKLYQHD